MDHELAESVLLRAKDYAAASVFRPENLLREARRQRRLPDAPVPAICVLDPDGDLQDHLRNSGRSAAFPGWACYHTTLDAFDFGGIRMGVVGRAVGASFAVLVAEQLFASGCRFLISVTSAGQISATGPTNYFVLIDRALRDEGTSYHYLPPSEWADADRNLADMAFEALADVDVTVRRGPAWTTDAPYRETEAAIADARARGALAVEMEAAALYAFARARAKPVLCFAHVTNQMAQEPGDFEKGEGEGSRDALAVLSAVARSWQDGLKPGAETSETGAAVTS
jgi:uridine phosphorylase